MREIGAGHDASPAQVALAWLLAKPHVASVLVGASNPRQLDDNLHAASVVLAPEELAALDEMTAPTPLYPNWFNEKIVDAPVRDALAPG